MKKEGNKKEVWREPTEKNIVLNDSMEGDDLLL